MVFNCCAAVIVYGNHSFGLYQYNKSSTSKVKFRQVSHCFKSLLEATKLTYANKTITSQNLPIVTFSGTKVNLVYLFYLTDLRSCLLLLIKENYFKKILSKNFNLDDSALFQNLHNFHVTSNLVKKLITDLNGQRDLTLIAFLWWF